MTEYRAWITIPGLPFEPASRWEPIIGALERDHEALGPIITWNDDATIVLATDADDEAHAAAITTAAVIDALRTAGRGDLYPSGIEVEAVDQQELAPA